MTQTFFQDFSRESVDEDGNGIETVVTVEFTMTPIVPASYWEPAEGGEVEIVKVFTDPEGWDVKWTDEEDEAWCAWIAEHVNPNELYDDAEADYLADLAREG